MPDRRIQNDSTRPTPAARPAAIDPEELPDSVEHGEDVSMGPGAVLPGKPRLRRSASDLVEPDPDNDPQAR